MALYTFVYTPETLAVADKPVWVTATDGDTPTIQLPIRMLGMDAPEYHYGGATKNNPGKFDSVIKTFLQKEGKDLDAGLKAYLQPRLTTGDTCTRQIKAGEEAYTHFELIAAERLKRVNNNGKILTPRKLFIMVAKDVFDRYGRLLAYVNAAYTKAERNTIPIDQRPTFNLQMIQDGYAVSLLIYSNVPKTADLLLVQDAVCNARNNKIGMWKDSDYILPYEFRWIVDTIRGKRKGPDRYCADISTGILYSPQEYYIVLPENRLFFYKEHVGEAIKMGFTF